MLAECCLPPRSGLRIASRQDLSLRLRRSASSCRLTSTSVRWSSSVLIVRLLEQPRVGRDLEASLTRLMSDTDEDAGDRHDATDRFGEGVSKLLRPRQRCRDRARDWDRDEQTEHHDATE
mmetsp:Transcript_60043/g.178754  ORF Transcript_60043/g.178754 Transcript_60043/m.178754 type:complete len:120 (-) Transcript_60043:884-1243(-)